MGIGGRLRRVILMTGLAMLLGTASAYATVPTPTVEGPITGGSHGRPWWSTPLDLSQHGYVEEEYFLSGTSTSRGITGTGQTAPYKVRILVRRPVDPDKFNGSAVLEWANVSLQMEIEHDWPLDAAEMMREGYVSAMVSAQYIGIEGEGPFALKNWDPDRYGTLHHPGPDDSHSYDIWAQAAQAIRAGLVDGGLVPNVIIGSGTSQSCVRMIDYLRDMAAEDDVFDGYYPTLCPDIPFSGVPTNLVPIVYGTSESEAAIYESQADSGLMKVWEIPGAHINYYEGSQGQAQIQRDSDPPTGTGEWDEDDAGQYGERGPVEVTATPPVNFLFGNTFPTRYAFRAILRHLNRWATEYKEYRLGERSLEDVTPAPTAPRFSRVGPTQTLHDEYGNVVGGVPSPALQVPVATYETGSFGGRTTPLDPARLLLLYPTHTSYVCQMQQAVDDAVASGYMLAEDAPEWMRRVNAAPIPIDPTASSGTIVIKNDSAPNDPQDFSFTASCGLSPVDFQLDDDSDSTLSDTQMFTNVAPGGGYSVSESVPSGWELSSAACDNGSPVSNISVSAGETVICTFTNTKIVGYARPKSATPHRIALVPAYEPCGEASNATHGAPLAVPSCNPPVQSSDYLTVGGPDANGKPAVAAGSLNVKVVGESPIDPDNGDQADVELTATFTDVRNKADLSDYTGELRAVIGLRITDRYNGATLQSAGTVADTPIAFNVACSATAGPEGGACNVATTADAVTAGIAREGKRAIWELGQVQIYDGGADGDGDTAGDNTLFAVQGLFAP